MNAQSITLSQMLGLVKEAVGMLFDKGLWLTAEVLQVSGGAHRYIELVEYDSDRKELAKTRGVVWKGSSGVLDKFQKCTGNPLSSGMKILFKAIPKFSEVHGLSLTVLDIDPTYTLGDMEARLNQIRQHLKENGWWSMNRSLKTPLEFCRLAVISPADAAGLGDFRVAADRLEKAGLCEFRYYPAAFQGDEAANQIVDQMVKVLDEHKVQPFDALVMIRGGGDKAGLYHLNNRRLATAVCRFPLPIMVGIGHERDSVLIDEIANVRFATPSLLVSEIRHTIIQNAQRAMANWERLNHLANQVLLRADSQCDQLVAKLVEGASNQLTSADNSLERLHMRLTHEASGCVSNAEQSIQKLGKVFVRRADEYFDALDVTLNAKKEKMLSAASGSLQNADRLVDLMGSSVMSANPIAILGRGYAYVRQGNKFVRTVDDVAVGDQVKINLQTGHLLAKVEETAIE